MRTLMVAKGTKEVPIWLSYLDLACAALAGALWYALPQLGPWPLAVAVLPWALRLIRTGRLTRTTPFDALLILFLFLAGLAVWSAYDRQEAGPKFWLIAGGVILYYALVNATALGHVRAWLLAVFGAGVAVYFLLTHDWLALPAKIESLTRLGRALQAPLPALPGHRLHPNVAGGIMAAMFPFAVLAVGKAVVGVRHAEGRGRGRWLLLGLGLLVCATLAFGLLMTTSRGAWLALGGALVLGAATWIAWRLSRWLGRHRPALQRWVLPALIVALLAPALALVLGWPGGIGAALDVLPGPNTTSGRAALLRNSLVLVHDYALLGAGLNGFPMLYSTYALLIHVGHSPHTHNLFLDIAIEQGLPSLLVLILAWLLFALAVYRALGRPLLRPNMRRGEEQQGEGAALLGAAALSLVVTLAHGMVDDVYYGSRAVLLLFVPLAFAVPFLVTASRPPGSRGRRRGLLALGGGMGLLVLLALIWRGPMLSLAYSNLGAVHQSQSELSLYSWPEWPIQDALRREIDLSRPLAEYEQALALDPGNASASRRLGQIELSLAEYEDALAHLESAYAAEPWSPTTRQLYGEALIANGFLAEGEALWATLNPGEGQLQARAFWYDFIGDAERAAWMWLAAGDR
jgi:O-antigen ligase